MRSQALRLSIASRIFLGFLSVIAVFTVVAVFSLSKLHKTGEQLRLLNECYIPLTKAATQLDAFHQNKTAAVNRILEVQDLKAKKMFLKLAKLALAKGIPEKISELRRIVEKAKGLQRDDAEFRTRTTDQLEKIGRLYADYGENAESLFSQIEAGAENTEIQTAELHRSERELQNAIKMLSLSLDDKITASVMNASKEEVSSAWVVIMLTGAAVVISVLITAVSHLMLNPLTRLTEGIKRISQGEYGRKVLVESSTEIGVMAGELNRTSEVLRARDDEIRKAYEKLKHTNVELEALKAYNENILQSIRIGIIVTDRSLRVTFINRAASEIWGNEAGGAYKGGLLDLPLGRHIAGQKPRIEAVASGASGFDTGALSIPHPGGQRFVEVMAHPLLEAGGSALGALILSEDTTGEEKVRGKLLQSERLAAVGRLAAQITHEIRNPLNSLALNTELLRDEIEKTAPAPGSQAALLTDAIGAEVDRLTAVTEEYLRFARLPQKKRQPEDLNEIIRNMIQFFERELSGKEIAIETDLPEGLPKVSADENQIRQALINLIRNSIDSMPAGGRITVKTWSIENAVFAEISDTGQGISENLLPRIFDAFFSTKESGTGLGLALTQQIVGEHGGDITARSKPGEGASFTVKLPAAGG